MKKLIPYILLLSAFYLRGQAYIVDGKIIKGGGGSGYVNTDSINVALNGKLPTTAGSVGTNNLADDAVTTAKIGPSQIDNSHIKSNTITGNKITDAQINTQHLVNGAVDSDRIADGAIDEIDLNIFNTPVNNQVLCWDQINGLRWCDPGASGASEEVISLTQDTTLTASAFDNTKLYENVQGYTVDVTIQDDGSIPKGRFVKFQQTSASGKIRVRYDNSNPIPGILASTVDSISGFRLQKMTTHYIAQGLWELFNDVGDPPLSGNVNPELNNSNASGFGSDNANNLWPSGGSDGEYQIIGNVTLNTVADTSHGFGGTHVLEVVDGEGDGGDYPRVWQSTTTGEIYEYSVWYYNVDCDDAVFQIDGGGSSVGKEVDLTVQGVWTEAKGEWSADDSLANWRVFTNKNGTGQPGDRILILVSIKLKDD
ncbi:MAG: hypothetical protein AAF634_11615 [Bacteroidota bacterium]